MAPTGPGAQQKNGPKGPRAQQMNGPNRAHPTNESPRMGATGPGAQHGPTNEWAQQGYDKNVKNTLHYDKIVYHGSDFKRYLHPVMSRVHSPVFKEHALGLTASAALCSETGMKYVE